MIAQQRRRVILAHLSRADQVTVNQLATELRASKETIRRDLADLDAQHLLRRVHGGAVPAQTGAEEAFNRRALQHRTEKQRIGTRAAELFKSGDSLFIDAGTTTAAFAGALARLSGLTVFTNSMEVAARLWAGPGEIRVHVLGGDYYGEVAETLGAETVHQINRLRADHAVLTVGTVDAEGGFMDFNMDEATVATAMVRSARTVTVLADHSKLGRTSQVRVCALSPVARLVTDAPPPATLAEALERGGVEVLLA
ncbi:MAG: DeoR/GlpR transcriptional regulator [Gammaproteobacteria bacterium]|nr:DeoR/GlpR transcriptional regulator [Gammaproteobacteria bacterium]NIR83000.1 DeoR/GlpR transcriptional regulator [Gammaproteobacteria bacterium]NIR90655.1 DeoR/GlpR transcriptional regulator [Gammaproteobacteria bacterium]NIU04157.1 DeoR/GlpR transcriptional regulator [Gammaproteobacteria bacterium]NIV51448.1 DeoR family transcriptional regulator [Gammaproteobacteria bacterium]